MTPGFLAWLTGAVLAGVLAFGCTPAGDDGAQGPATPVPIDAQAGAVCGMILRDQAAPRGQVLHRDGSRAFLCSLGDLLVHLSAPSPHGEAREVFVEVLDPSDDPLEVRKTGLHPWRPASQATYVVGVPRAGIMGPPVLAYADPADARQVARRHEGAVVLDFPGLERWWREAAGR